ncbi:fungal-specific transcription factor domain-containing protein [Peziza echinospora]|nr:fungal-specific transcription factor domain-containing protein [Peziza echinospora]
MPPKRQSPSSAAIPRMAPPGMPKPIEFHSSDEFTRSVKRKLSSSTRTGQACDRCKVRKIRCDGLQGGCSPCIQNHTECRTTDRISQRAMPRGYVENLESKCMELEEKLKEAQAALALERGVRGGNPAAAAVDYMNGGAKNDESGARSGAGYVNWSNAGDYGDKLESYMGGSSKRHPKLRAGDDPERLRSSRTGVSTGAYYLGLSSGASTLNSIKDSALSVLGIEIDLSDVDPSEEDGPDGLAESYSRFLSSMFNTNPNTPQNLSLPPKAEFIGMVEWFFSYSFPYLPVLHRPTFIPQVERIFDKDFQPSAGLMVQAHMIVAIYYWQFGTRERTSLQETPAKLDLSYQHYYYALTHFAAMLNSAGLEDLQALCLVLQHLRGFRKPGATWFIARLATSMAVELGLHRSTKGWKNQPVQNYIHEEMKKRVWWCLLAVEVSLGAKLGRPLSVREGDYDTELPMRIDDEYITAEGILPVPDNVEGCRFDVGIELFKIIPLYTEINCSLYTITRPSREKYVKLVEDMEQKLLEWRDGVPKYISQDSPKVDHRFQAIHLDLWLHECRLLIRHPSLSLSISPSFNRKSVNLCVESSREILRLTDILRKYNIYLDTTWYAITLQMLATLTILFSMWKTGDQDITQEQINQVQADMDLCQDIMGDIGILLGKPHTLKDVVKKLTQGTMDYLYQRQQFLNPPNAHRGKNVPKEVIGSSVLSIGPPPPSTTSPTSTLPSSATASTLPYYPIQPSSAYTVTVPVSVPSSQGQKLALVAAQLLPSHHDGSEGNTVRVASQSQPSSATSVYHNTTSSGQSVQAQYGMSIGSTATGGAYSHLPSANTSPGPETSVGGGGDVVTSGYYSNAQHLQQHQQYPWGGGWHDYVGYVSTIDIEPTHNHQHNQQLHQPQHHQQHHSHHQQQQPQQQQHTQQHSHQHQQHQQHQQAQQQRTRLAHHASNSSLVQAGLAGLMTLGVGNDGGWPGYSLSSEGVGRGNGMPGDNIP